MHVIIINIVTLWAATNPYYYDRSDVRIQYAAARAEFKLELVARLSDNMPAKSIHSFP